MITRLKISNFRSLGTIDIKPGRLNFLVGPNGSGKSNFLHALTFVREAVRMGLPGAITNDGGIEAVRRHSSGHPRNVRIDMEIELKTGTARYGFEITGDRSEEYRVKSEFGAVQKGSEIAEFSVDGGTWSGPENLRPSLDHQSLAITTLGGDERIKPLWDFLANMMVYAIYPDILRRPQPFSSETPMKPQGNNWVTILYQREKSGWKADLVAALHQLTGDIDDIRLSKAAGFLMVEFRHQGQDPKARKWFGAALESDGTLRVAGLLTALLQEPPLPVIGIEEPELTVHPGALLLIHDYLRESSERSQVFITTHSPLLLDHLDLRESSVFVVQRQGGATSAESLSDRHKKAVIDQLLTLGELMVTGDLQLPLRFPKG